MISSSKVKKNYWQRIGHLLPVTPAVYYEVIKYCCIPMLDVPASITWMYIRVSQENERTEIENRAMKTKFLASATIGTLLYVWLRQLVS